MFLKFFIVHIICLTHLYASKIGDNCKTCREIVSNFHKGMEKTAKNHFGGGDTAWEESRLGSYARSETRLLEILEGVCQGVSKESRCHALVEEHEEVVENFWFNKHNELSELESFLCINEIKVCCLAGKYGKNCEDCPGGADNPCLGRGTCEGAGTRSGDGKCNCNTEYDGDKCEECDDEYYDAGNSTCKKCDDSCESSCTDGTNKGCDSCKDGYIENDEQACIDKNECDDVDTCKEGTFCFNIKGSYRCNNCDPACDGGCTGSGRLSCMNCKPGWKLKDAEKGCDDVNECDTADICAVGTHCMNSEGSYTCASCHKACTNGCTGDGPSLCNDCAKGYTQSDEGCTDVNECEGNTISCPRGHVCVNRDGPDQCEACDPSCIECVNTDPSGCLLCQPGYLLNGGKCEDIDECLSKSCNADTETCHNSPGSFKCKCKKGLVRSKKGVCVKKKGKSTQNVIENTEEFERDMEQGRFLTERHLKIGSLLYAVFFGAILLLYKVERYYSIGGLVLIHCLVIAYVQVKYPRDDGI